MVWVRRTILKQKCAEKRPRLKAFWGPRATGRTMGTSSVAAGPAPANFARQAIAVHVAISFSWLYAWQDMEMVSGMGRSDGPCARSQFLRCFSWPSVKIN